MDRAIIRSGEWRIISSSSSVSDVDPTTEAAAPNGAGLGASSELDKLESSLPLPRLQLSASWARSTVCVCLAADSAMANKTCCCLSCKQE